jgi:hypothetical protein
MPIVEQVYPSERSIAVHDLLAEVRAADGLRHFDERAVDFLVRLSRRLLRDPAASRFPELVALGFFLRPAELERLTELDRLAQTPNRRRYPRGLVFHIPPSSVDTMFVYSWALSLLSGNSNVVRLSQRSGAAAAAILVALRQIVGELLDPSIAATQRIVRYGHDDDATAVLSDACDLRVIWGGDASVSALREHPLRPSARDLPFPDRHSFAVLAVDAYARADDARRDRLALGLYNDVYWFDQAGCASPRWLIWCGPDDLGVLDELRSDLAERLIAVIAAKGTHVEAGMAIEKLTNAYGAAIQGGVVEIHRWTNELTTIRAQSLDGLPRGYFGAGMFFEAYVTRLDELAPRMQRRDQTITHFGFDLAELTEFADACNGRGVDRLVPIGDALAFNNVWDGFDLLGEFSRLVALTPSVATVPDGEAEQT